MSLLIDTFRECYEVFSRRVHPAGEASKMCELHYLSWYERFEYDGGVCKCYLIRLYLLVERLYIVFDIIELAEEYRHRHFSVVRDVHKWANFIKHPGPFLLVHHPDYFMAHDPGFQKQKFDVVIDQEFVNKHYGGPGQKRKKLWDALTNKRNVAVLFPSPIDLTNQFCGAIEHFLEMINTNAVFRSRFHSRTTTRSGRRYF